MTKVLEHAQDTNKVDQVEIIIDVNHLYFDVCSEITFLDWNLMLLQPFQPLLQLQDLLLLWMSPQVWPPVSRPTLHLTKILAMLLWHLLVLQGFLAVPVVALVVISMITLPSNPSNHPLSACCGIIA